MAGGEVTAPEARNVTTPEARNVTAPEALKAVLTVAGSDSGGGAGIQADLSTFHAFGVFGTTAITAITAQNTVGVQGIEVLSVEMVLAQISSVLDDIAVQAAKTGMLATAELTRAVASALAGRVANLVVDPVFVSKHGDTLLADDAIDAVREHLLPIATVVTPNLPEAARLVGRDEIATTDEMLGAAEELLDLGPKMVVLKGGHLASDRSDDLVLTRSGALWLPADRIAQRHTHGTGCTLSAAIAALLAHGFDPMAAVRGAKQFVTSAITNGVDVGRGIGPVNSVGRQAREVAAAVLAD